MRKTTASTERPPLHTSTKPRNRGSGRVDASRASGKKFLYFSLTIIVCRHYGRLYHKHQHEIRSNRGSGRDDTSLTSSKFFPPFSFSLLNIIVYSRYALALQPDQGEHSCYFTLGIFIFIFFFSFLLNDYFQFAYMCRE